MAKIIPAPVFRHYYTGTVVRSIGNDTLKRVGMPLAEEDPVAILGTLR